MSQTWANRYGPTRALRFFLEHYKEQLVVGYTKTTPDFELRVFMRDFNKV